MTKVDVNDLEGENTDPKKEATLSEEDVNHVKGGAGYLKIGDIKGESKFESTVGNKQEPYIVAPTIDKKIFKF